MAVQHIFAAEGCEARDDAHRLSGANYDGVLPPRLVRGGGPPVAIEDQEVDEVDVNRCSCSSNGPNGRFSNCQISTAPCYTRSAIADGSKVRPLVVQRKGGNAGASLRLGSRVEHSSNAPLFPTRRPSSGFPRSDRLSWHATNGAVPNRQGADPFSTEPRPPRRSANRFLIPPTG